MSDTAIVATIPPCDLCKETGTEESAYADASIRIGHRQTWAFVCVRHFNMYGSGLGTGRGQRLVLAEESEEQAAERTLSALAATESGDDEDEYVDPEVDTEFVSREHEAAAKYLADLIRKRDEADQKIALTDAERQSWNRRIAKASIIMHTNAMKGARR